jgi:hypothetical protein
MKFLLPAISLLALARATPVIYDGRAPFNLTEADLDTSTGPYLTAVKGSTENASHYSTLLGKKVAATPLWSKYSMRLPPSEQAISVAIDNSSVFVPGGGASQFGFRRTELIAQTNNNHTALDALMEVGVTVFHFSIMMDKAKPLNFSHEYQIVFIEPNDGTHVFGIQLGSPFTIPTGPLPAANAQSFKVLDHASNILFSTPFSEDTWHNFAVQVDWDNRTLAVLYSANGDTLKAVTKVVSNPTATAGAAGQGDFHFGVLKLPLANPADSSANQGDVVHHGIQEGTTEALVYSGVFVESATGGVSAGNGCIIKQIS